MKIKLLPILLSAVVFGSCTTAYRTGQTPDDVYYSPARQVEEQTYTKYETRREIDRYEFEDRQIRMSAYDRRWRYLDNDYDYNYSYNPYVYGYSYGYYYNPYYYPGPVYISGVSISNPKNTTPRMTNLGSYTNTKTVVADGKTGITYQSTPIRTYNSSNRTSTRRSTYNTDYNTNSRTTTSESNNRSYTPSTSTPSSSGSGSSGSSSGGVSRPSRGQ